MQIQATSSGLLKHVFWGQTQVARLALPQGPREIMQLTEGTRHRNKPGLWSYTL